MKEKWLFLMLFLFITIGTSKLNAQSLIIQLSDGTENIEPLNTVQKLAFSASNLLVTFKFGSIDTYDLSTLQKLYFDANISVEEKPLANTYKLSVYPNPAGETIRVQNIPDEANRLYIYRPDGQVMLMEAVSSNDVTIDISSLSPGLYLLSANGHSSKFIKQ